MLKYNSPSFCIVRSLCVVREFSTREYRVYFLGGAAARGGDGDALIVYTPASLDKDEGSGIAVDSLSLPPGTFYWKDSTPMTGGGNDLCQSSLETLTVH